MFKRLFAAIGSFIKRRPIASIMILVVFAIVALAATYEIMHMTSKPEFCRMCHPQEGTGALSEYHTWSQNVHAANGIECLDCHSKQPGAWGYFRAKLGGLYDLGAEFVISDEHKLELLSRFEGNPAESAELVKANICMHCHTDSINTENRDEHWMSFAGVKMRELDRVKNPEWRAQFNTPDILQAAVRFGVEPNHSMHITEQNIACAECHATVSHSGEFRSPLDMQTCFTCHDSRRETADLAPAANEDCLTCHVTQNAIQDGTALAELGVTGDAWSMLSDCSICHADPFELPTVETTCFMGCHEDDEAYAPMLEMFQADYETSIQAEWEFYKAQLPERLNMPADKREAFNKYEVMLATLEADGSRGFHNTAYVNDVLAAMGEIRDFIAK